MVPLITVASSAVTAILVSSAANMYQTYKVSNRFFRNDNDTELLSLTSGNTQHVLNKYLNSAGRIQVPKEKKVEEVVQDLKELSREELLLLFLSCEAPKDSNDITGEWNGGLLDNNGWIMTSVGDLLTNQLFSMGRTWNGKSFLGRETSVGENRFRPRLRSDDLEKIEREHKFQYSLEPSRLNANSPSLTLKYSKYQGKLSLWNSMRDELRVLRLPQQEGKKGGGIMIGMGCMAWSGAFWRDGMMNCSPFCLWTND